MLGGMFRDSDSLTNQRRRQIDTLKIFNANVSEVEPDREYRVDFASGSLHLALFIVLPLDFPTARPALKIVPAVRHAWLDDAGRVTSAPGLLNFTALSDLGRVVQAIVRELELRPAPLVGPVASPHHHHHHHHHTATSLSDHVFPLLGSPPGGSLSSPPPSMFPELNSLSLAELEELNSSEDRLYEFVDSLPAVAKLNDAVDKLIDANQLAAEETLSAEQRLAELRAEVEREWAEAAESHRRYDQLDKRYRHLADRYSPHSIRERLRTAAASVDEESESVAERFLNGEVDLDTFLADYTHKRMLSYCRKTKEEKLSHQLEELHRAGF